MFCSFACCSFATSKTSEGHGSLALADRFFREVQFCFVLKSRMRQATRRDGDFDTTDEINTLRPLLFNEGVGHSLTVVTFRMIGILASDHMLL